MANNKTTYLENKILDHVLGVAAFTAPTPYVALFTADPGEAGSLGSEVGSGVGYARQALSVNAAASGATDTDADLVFGPATADWGSITHIGIMDGNTIGAGNMLYHVPLDAARTIQSGGTLRIAAGDLTFAEE